MKRNQVRDWRSRTRREENGVKNQIRRDSTIRSKEFVDRLRQ